MKKIFFGLTIGIVLLTAACAEQKKFETNETLQKLAEDDGKNKEAISKKDVKPYEEAVFDGCGKPEKYKDQPWYSAFVYGLQKYDPKIKIAEITDSCYADNANLYIITMPQGYALPSVIVRFNTSTHDIAKAEIKDEGRRFLAGWEEFGKREGHVIKIVGKSGDAGCESNMYFDYDFVKNTVELKKEMNRCVEMELNEKGEIVDEKWGAEEWRSY